MKREGGCRVREWGEREERERTTREDTLTVLLRFLDSGRVSVGDGDRRKMRQSSLFVLQHSQ